MPPAVAALIRGEIRGKNIGLAIRGITAANERFGQVQIIVGAAQGSRSFELSSVERHCQLSPSLVVRLLINGDTFRARRASCDGGGRLFMAGETIGLGVKLRGRSLQQRDAALNRSPDIGR